MDTLTAAEALREVRSANDLVAERMVCPPSWRWMFGATLGAMIAGQAAPPVVACCVLAVAMAAVVLMVRAMRKRMGFFVNGYRRGRTRRIAIGLLVFTEATLFTCLWLKLGRHIWWAPLAGGALVVPVAVVASSAWQAAFKRDLAEGAAR